MEIELLILQTLFQRFLQYKVTIKKSKVIFISQGYNDDELRQGDILPILLDAINSQKL